MDSNFGKNIKTLRKKKDLTQEMIAERSCLSVSYIGHIERGERVPSLAILQRIADALDCNLIDLLSDSDMESLNGKMNHIKDIDAMGIELLKEIKTMIDKYFGEETNESH